MEIWMKQCNSYIMAVLHNIEFQIFEMSYSALKKGCKNMPPSVQVEVVQGDHYYKDYTEFVCSSSHQNLFKSESKNFANSDARPDQIKTQCGDFTRGFFYKIAAQVFFPKKVWMLIACSNRSYEKILKLT